MLAAINTLGEKHRIVVLLRYYADLSNEEIAQTLDIPSGTVRSRLFTARQRLRIMLGEERATALDRVTEQAAASS
jgi:RNA polymerase sigma-70 factor (ECF subfamily)